MNAEFIAKLAPSGSDDVLSYGLKTVAKNTGLSLAETLQKTVNEPEVMADSDSVMLLWDAFHRILSGTEEGAKAW